MTEQNTAPPRRIHRAKNAQEQEEPGFIAPSACVGPEPANSPARGLLTLFLVGRMTRKQIVDFIDTAQEDARVLAQNLHLSHLHFGAGGSFNGEQSAVWLDNLRHFLREGFWCTLEMRPTHLSLIYKTGLCRQSRFIPLIILPMPHIHELGHNAILQIDGSTASWSTAFAGLLQQRGVGNAPSPQCIPIKGTHEA